METILGADLWALLPLDLKPQVEQAWQNHELELQAIQVGSVPIRVMEYPACSDSLSSV